MTALALKMRFSLKAIFLLTLGAGALLAAPWQGVFMSALPLLAIAVPLAALAAMNVALVGGLMSTLAAIDWALRQLRR